MTGSLPEAAVRPADAAGVAAGSAEATVEACVTAAVQRYLAALDGHAAHDLHRLVIGEVERPLLATVMAHCDGNLTAAATLLGLNRATVRRKLAQYGLAGAGD
jgi:Fis family transcriptional regulator